MPVPARSCQARHLNTEHDSDVAEPNLRDQPLKAKAAFDARARSPEIIVNDHDGLARPPKLKRPIGQRVLQPRRLLMTLNLLHRGLADVDHREALAMVPKDFVGHDAALRRCEIVHHRRSPRSQTRFGAVAGPSVPASQQCLAAALAAASATAGAGTRSLRDPSQRARAHSAWNPSFGDSPTAVNLSAAFSIGYRGGVQKPQGRSGSAPDLPSND